MEAQTRRDAPAADGRRAADRGPRPADALLGPRLLRRPPARPRVRLGDGRRRGQLRSAPRRGARPGRRVGVGQDDARADAARAGRRRPRGSIKLRGEEITGLSEGEMRPLRRRLQIVFQDPHASLNPAMTIGAAIGDPLRFHGIAAGKARAASAASREALERVGLAPASQFADKYPTDLSGGQKQRAVLARAIILGPDILVADEPVSMLDMSVRAKILELMIELKTRARSDLRLHHPRPRDGEVLLRPDRDHVPRPDRRARPRRADLRRPQAPVHAVAAAGDPRARPDAARVPRDLPRGEIPDAVAPPLGCSLPPPLPAGLRGLRLGEPRPAHRARGALDEDARGRVRGRARADRRPRRARPGVVRDGAPLVRRALRRERRAGASTAMRKRHARRPAVEGRRRDRGRRRRGRGVLPRGRSNRAGSTSTGSRSSATCTTPRRCAARSGRLERTRPRSGAGQTRLVRARRSAARSAARGRSGCTRCRGRS